MGKRLIIFLLAVWCTIAVLLAGLFVYFLKGGAGAVKFNLFNFHWNTAALVESYDSTFNSDGIGKISVDVNAADISVTQSDTDKIRVIVKTADNESEKQSVSVKNENGTLSIAKKETAGFFFWNTRSAAVEIELPKSYSKDISLALSSGDISLAGDYSFENADFSASTGDFNADSLTAGKFSLESSTGDITIGSLDSDNITVKSSVGDVSLQKFAGSGTVRTSTGDVSVSLQRLDGTTKISTSTGDVNIEMPETVNAQLNAKTSMGDINSAFALEYSGINKNNASGIIGSGALNELDVSTSIGDITLKKS